MNEIKKSKYKKIEPLKTLSVIGITLSIIGILLFILEGISSCDSMLSVNYDYYVLKTADQLELKLADIVYAVRRIGSFLGIVGCGICLLLCFIIRAQIKKKP